MRTVLTALIGAAALTTLAPPASAQTAVDKSDVRCIMVLQVAAREPKNAAAAQQGMFYFIGRVDGRGMAGKLESLMLSESKAITSAAMVQGELTRCGSELNQRSAALRTMSQRLAATVQPAKPPVK